MKIVLDHLKLPKPSSRVLHFAPEERLAHLFRSVCPEGYNPVDIDPTEYPFVDCRKFDLVSDPPSLPSEKYDLIVHNHVLEHIPINIAAILHHLHRALKPDGYHLFSVPIHAVSYDEYFGPLDPSEAHAGFGQSDHVRIFGRADIDRHRGHC